MPTAWACANLVKGAKDVGEELVTRAAELAGLVRVQGQPGRARSAGHDQWVNAGRRSKPPCDATAHVRWVQKVFAELQVVVVAKGSQDGPGRLEAAALDEQDVEEDKAYEPGPRTVPVRASTGRLRPWSGGGDDGARTHLCDAVVDDAVGHVFPHDALDALQLLLLQRGAEACALWRGAGAGTEGGNASNHQPILCRSRLSRRPSARTWNSFSSSSLRMPSLSKSHSLKMRWSAWVHLGLRFCGSMSRSRSQR